MRFKTICRNFNGFGILYSCVCIIMKSSLRKLAWGVRKYITFSWWPRVMMSETLQCIRLVTWKEQRGDVDPSLIFSRFPNLLECTQNNRLKLRCTIQSIVKSSFHSQTANLRSVYQRCVYQRCVSERKFPSIYSLVNLLQKATSYRVFSF